MLAGDEEARLTFLGATSERDPSDRRPTLVLDIGGGSTELVIGEGREVVFHVSTQAGVVRQTERHITQDPPTEAEQDELAADVRGIIARRRARGPARRRRARHRRRRDRHVAGARSPSTSTPTTRSKRPRLPAEPPRSATGSWTGCRR